jgi:membrane protease YdiL (CAAX protease family)
MTDSATSPQTTRIPNLFHLLLFLALTFFALIFCESLLVALNPHDIAATLQDQHLQLFASIATYVLALGAATFLFPLLWHRDFATGISWNPTAARPRLILLGLSLGALSQAVSTLLPIPKELPIEKVFQTPGIIWLLAFFGTIVAPLFEEIVFRGFLLPALAIAVDYLRLPKSLEALEAWRTSEALSLPALITSSIITSLCFAAIHAPQLGFSWPAVALLASVSLVLCYVRIRTKSVAASTLVHACYNLSVFLTLFVSTGGFRHMDRL